MPPASSGHGRSGGFLGAGHSDDRGQEGVGRDRGRSSAGSGAPADSVVIHVRDEARGLSRDYNCSRGLLLSHMKYFEACLEDVAPSDSVDISVQCDVDVFEWLLDCMHDERKIETLDAKTVVYIVISAEFLQMMSLVEHCLTFMRKCIDEVVRQPLDLRCISDELVKKLAGLFTAEELDDFRDSRDKLRSRLFAEKVTELLTASPENSLQRCSLCSKVFLPCRLRRSVCPKAPLTIGFHGEAMASHVIDTSFSVSSYVQRCRERQKLSWCQIYWRLWGQHQLLHCSACGDAFSGVELGHCAYHPESPLWPPGAALGADGRYPCCGRVAYRFGTVDPRECRGCCGRDHVVSPDDKEAAVRLARLQRRRALFCEDFEASGNEACDAAASLGAC